MTKEYNHFFTVCEYRFHFENYFPLLLLMRYYMYGTRSDYFLHFLNILSKKKLCYKKNGKPLEPLYDAISVVQVNAL